MQDSLPDGVLYSDASLVALGRSSRRVPVERCVVRGGVRPGHSEWALIHWCLAQMPVAGIPVAGFGWDLFQW